MVTVDRIITNILFACFFTHTAHNELMHKHETAAGVAAVGACVFAVMALAIFITAVIKRVR